MEGMSPFTFKFQKIMYAVQIPPSSSILGKKTELPLDPELILRRLITVCSDDNLNSALKHELAHHPMSLFAKRFKEGRLS